MSSILLENLQWLSVGAGRMALYHRPKRIDLPALKAAGCSLVVTLLCEREGGQEVGTRVAHAGIEWLWLPLENGRLPQGEAHERLAAALPGLSARLDAGQSILIHCSAGIHRTGMLAFGLLRWRGLDETEAMQKIAQMRRFTAEGLQETQKRWIGIVLQEKEAGAGDPPGLVL